MELGKTYGIDVSFEELKLPLFHDVLILAKNATQGKHGLSKSLELLAPGVFRPIETDSELEHIEAVFVNRKLLTKIPIAQITNILQQHVFEHVAEGELIQVNMNVRISIHNVNA